MDDLKLAFNLASRGGGSFHRSNLETFHCWSHSKYGSLLYAPQPVPLHATPSVRGYVLRTCSRNLLAWNARRPWTGRGKFAETVDTFEQVSPSAIPLAVVALLSRKNPPIFLSSRLIKYASLFPLPFFPPLCVFDPLKFSCSFLSFSSFSPSLEIKFTSHPSLFQSIRENITRIRLEFVCSHFFFFFFFHWTNPSDERRVETRARAQGNKRKKW